MSGIILCKYPVLSTYAIVAQSGITTVNKTVVNEGRKLFGGVVQITGTFVPTRSPSGNNQANIGRKYSNQPVGGGYQYVHRECRHKSYRGVAV